ncbi:hypothetical protein NE237_028460 [Protea cynaroides]|uniref:Uncharacterized protein n=1 Tax=Protea cynaroides TaxID=273540 RepID=A0A9Q0GPY0_9MAGN|nr:hypothetical protein NE237_028460 [Protea cynaroides]
MRISTNIALAVLPPYWVLHPFAPTPPLGLQHESKLKPYNLIIGGSSEEEILEPRRRFISSSRLQQQHQNPKPAREEGIPARLSGSKDYLEIPDSSGEANGEENDDPDVNKTRRLVKLEDQRDQSQPDMISPTMYDYRRDDYIMKSDSVSMYAS